MGEKMQRVSFWGGFFLFATFVCEAVYGAPVSEQIQQSHATCLNLDYPVESSAYSERQKAEKALEACSAWREYAQENKLNQLYFIDALRACHHLYSQPEKAIELAAISRSSNPAPTRFLERTGAFLADVCRVAAKYKAGDRVGHDDIKDLGQWLPFNDRASNIAWNAAFRAGSFDEAIKQLRVVTRNSSSPLLNMALAEAHIRQGDFPAAQKILEGFNEALEERIAELEKVKRNKSAVAGGPFDETRRLFRKSNDVSLLKDLHRQQISQSLLAMAANESGDPEGAVSTLDGLVSLTTYEGTIEELSARADIPDRLRKGLADLIKQGRSGTGRVTYSDFKQASFFAWQEYAIALAELDKLDDAMTIFEKMGANFPHQRRYLETRAAVYEKQGRPEMATAYREMKEKYPPFVPIGFSDVPHQIRLILDWLVPGSLITEGQWMHDRAWDEFGKLEKQKVRGDKHQIIYEVTAGVEAVPGALLPVLYRKALAMAQKERMPFIEIIYQRTYSLREAKRQSFIVGQTGTPQGKLAGYKAGLKFKLHRQPKDMSEIPTDWIAVSSVSNALEGLRFEKKIKDM